MIDGGNDIKESSADKAQSESTFVKCLVWDLDETIWSGRILDGDEPVLRPHIQSILSTLDQRGVLQSIASTNEREHAWEFLQQMELSEFFLVPQIHMGNKSDSIQTIAKSLNVNLQDMAFIDDDPMEREMAHRFLPSIRIYDASQYQTLPSLPEFQPSFNTSESQSRRIMLQAEMRRTEDETAYHTLEDFLHECNLQFTGRPAQESDLVRVSELAARTNRMNASGKRFSYEDIYRWRQQDERYVLVASLSDRYGQYGTIAGCLLHAVDTEMHCDAIWISCRVGKKGAPNAFFSYIARFAHQRGAKRLRIRYVSSERNRLAAFHLRTYGFEAKREDSKTVHFLLNLPDRIRQYPEWMKIEEES